LINGISLPVVFFVVREVRKAAKIGADILVPDTIVVVLFTRIITPSDKADISGTEREGALTRV
jgi:hypothetical protein